MYFGLQPIFLKRTTELFDNKHIHKRDENFVACARSCVCHSKACDTYEIGNNFIANRDAHLFHLRCGIESVYFSLHPSRGTFHGYLHEMT